MAVVPDAPYTASDGYRTSIDVALGGCCPTPLSREFLFFRAFSGAAEPS